MLHDILTMLRSFVIILNENDFHLELEIRCDKKGSCVTKAAGL